MRIAKVIGKVVFSRKLDEVIPGNYLVVRTCNRGYPGREKMRVMKKPRFYMIRLPPGKATWWAWWKDARRLPLFIRKKFRLNATALQYWTRSISTRFFR